MHAPRSVYTANQYLLDVGSSAGARDKHNRSRRAGLPRVAGNREMLQDLVQRSAELASAVQRNVDRRSQRGKLAAFCKAGQDQATALGQRKVYAGDACARGKAFITEKTASRWPICACRPGDNPNAPVPKHAFDAQLPDDGVS